MDNSFVPQKKQNKTLIITIIASAAAVIITAVIFCFVIIPAIAGDKDKNGEQTKVIIPSVDEKRAASLERFVDAAISFQSNNSGKTPWSSGVTQKNFVKNYISKTCTSETPDEIDTSCSDVFRDPYDDTPYYFKYETDLTGATGTTKLMLTKGTAIHVYTSAKCGEETGTLATTGGERQFALVFYRDSGYICKDNY